MKLVDQFLLTPSWPIICAFIFSILIFGLIIYILVYQYLVRLNHAKLQRWDFIAERIILDAIFFDEKRGLVSEGEDSGNVNSQKIRVSKRLRMLLKNQSFRGRLIEKMVAAKRNMSGAAAQNLSLLFRQLGLDMDILSWLSTSVWYRQAGAIELIGIMKLDDQQHLIKQYVDNQRGLIRMEAQNAELRFSGFGGLHFLIDSKYPLSEWQQIKLLDELSHIPHEEFIGIDEWLKSENDSVVIFALKLIRIYHRFELFLEVLHCLKHTNPGVRFHAISVLKALPSPDAVPVLLNSYPSETTLNKVEILIVLQAIASESEVDFLEGLLHEPEFEIVLEATRALHKIGQAGRQVLKKFDDLDAYPLNNIIAQVMEEEQ